MTGAEYTALHRLQVELDNWIAQMHVAEAAGKDMHMLKEVIKDTEQVCCDGWKRFIAEGVRD